MARATRQLPARRSAAHRAGISVGDYLCSEHDLYRVERLADGRVLVEDCRTGHLIDAPVRELSDLRRLER